MRVSQYLLHSFAPKIFDGSGTAYDLGDNHGEFGSYLAGKFKTVICVEPNAQLDLSDLKPNVQVERCAIGWPRTAGHVPRRCCAGRPSAPNCSRLTIWC